MSMGKIIELRRSQGAELKRTKIVELRRTPSCDVHGVSMRALIEDVWICSLIGCNRTYCETMGYETLGDPDPAA